MNALIQSPIQSVVSELTTLADLLSLLTLSTGTLPLDQSRPLVTGLSLAIGLVIEAQNQLEAIEAHSTGRTAA